MEWNKKLNSSEFKARPWPGYEKIGQTVLKKSQSDQVTKFPPVLKKARATDQGRRAIDAGVPLDRLERHDEPGTDEERQPHENVAQPPLNVGDEGQKKTDAAEHEQHHRVEVAQRERDDELMHDGWHDEDGHHGYKARAPAAQLVNVLVDVSVEPIVNYNCKTQPNQIETSSTMSVSSTQ